MMETECLIVNQLGLHARAAAKLVSTASRYISHIEIMKEGKKVNAKSIMGVMMLAAGKGSIVKLIAHGDDEKAAVLALTTLISERFGEAM